MQNHFIEYRQKAVDWLNGTRDFNEGIQILEESKFKPGVVAKLKKHGVNGPEAMSRLKFLMRELIQAWAMPDDQLADNVDPSTGLDAGAGSEGHVDAAAMKLVDAVKLLDAGEQTFPINISAIIREYAGAYKKRDALHKQLFDMPEDNDEKTMRARAELSDQIAALSDLMEKLYPLYEKYRAEGNDISDEEMKTLEGAGDDPKIKDTPEVDYSKLSKEDLQKARKSVSTKISRARNMLEYQQEAKAEVANPMPDCPKRVKYETKIANLSADIEKIDYAIAALG